MRLGPVSYLDCLVFCMLLAPQLIWHVGLFSTGYCVLQMLPFFCTYASPRCSYEVMQVTDGIKVIKLPASFVYERYLLPLKRRTSFVKRASPFEDFVVRCIRHAFANLPPHIGRVFFSKQVALPFLKLRLLRHGYIRSPISWREHREVRLPTPVSYPGTC